MQSQPERELDHIVGVWAEWLILGLVMLCIILLLVIPVGVRERNEQLRDRMDDLADPARAQVAEIQYHLAREMGALRGYLLTGDGTYVARQRQWVSRTIDALDELEDLLSALGPDAVSGLIQLRLEADRWHALTRIGAEAEPAPLRTAALEQRQFQATLEAAARLDGVLVETVRALRSDMRASERRALAYTVVLALLAMASTVALTWLGLRVRRLAREADRHGRESREALAETRRAIEGRNRLIRGITHDVKNPLGAADGYAELLQMGLRGALEPLQEETVRSIRRSIDAALGTIQDLLSLSEAQEASLALRVEQVRLSRLVQEAVEAHRGVAEASARKLAVETRDSDVVVRTDARRVEQILGNLLSNAIKHSGPGDAIRVAIVADGSTPGQGGAEIRVSDSGPGIPETELERIFDEFQRLDMGRPGHGLGLTISRTLARRLGGELSVESRPGEGATFVLWLPTEPPPNTDTAS